MRTRKTIDVEWLRNSINKSLAKTTCDPMGHYGLISALERVLHETNNYRGFELLMDINDPNYDASRRRYY
jgi:hypothetical protein